MLGGLSCPLGFSTNISIISSVFGKLIHTSLTGWWWGRGSRIGFVDTIFCPTLIHASKQKPKEIFFFLKKRSKTMNVKAKKGKNKYYMFEWWIKKLQHLKNPFYGKSDQNTNWVWSKSWLFYLTIRSCCLLDCLIGHVFPLQNDGFPIKIGVKMDETSQKY